MANPPRRASSSSESSASSSDVSSTSSGSHASMAEAASSPRSSPEQLSVAAGPRPWRFLDAEETCHFFNTEVVVNTNDVRSSCGLEDALGQADGAVGALDSDAPEAKAADDPPRPRLEPTHTRYEDVFSDFDDMYLPGIMANAPHKLRRQREAQCKAAAQVLAAFCTDLHDGQSFLCRKRSEFLRVCFRRALDAQKEQSVKDNTWDVSGLSRKVSRRGQQAFRFQCSRLERPIDVTVPALYPRKWPHIPFRDPRQWEGNPGAAIAFAKRVSELPEGSLLYEPLDEDEFTSRWCDLMKAEGIDIWTLGSTESKRLTETGIAALSAMLSLAVRLQSFSLLQLVAEVCLRFGHSSRFTDGCQGEELGRIVNGDMDTLRAFVGTRLPPATYPRGLVSQWKICSYQPSTSDAIATDGLFLYVYGRAGLLKVGTGRGSTMRDFVYARNRSYCRSRDAERSWLCLIGDNLYCRSITMACSRVDRICKNDLNSIVELYFSPPQQLAEQPVGSNSVYALVSDGIDLYVINSFDSQKIAPRKKANKSRKSSSSDSKVPSDRASGRNYSEDHVSAIRVGDRVVRGPHWKWGSQDGEKGSPGTVERISTWGGVKGCGVTVRWDKNQRINTYRWGAEGCYDIVVVVEKSDGQLKKKPLPDSLAGCTTKDEPVTPRYHFIVSRYDVSNLQCVVNLDQSTRQSLLGVRSLSSTVKPKNADGHQLLLTATHEHTVGTTSATTAWMCDGGTSGCLGDNSGVRYRCEQGCDFDLCEVCLTTSLIGKQPDLSREQSEPESISHEQRDGEQAVVSAASTESLPTSEGKGGDTSAISKKSVRDLGTAQIDDVVDFWFGLFSREECEFALQRAEQSFEAAVQWLSDCGEELKRTMILPCIRSLSLKAPPNSTGLDPILLVAGSFYAVDGHLCIISPPGLFQSERSKRTIHATDAAWFFSLEDGSLSFSQASPVHLKSVPAGSPVCVDYIRRRIVVFSGYLNCIEEYAFTTIPSEVESGTSLETVQQLGEKIYTFLHDADGQRWARKAFKTAHQGLHDWIGQIQNDAASSSANRVIQENSTHPTCSTKALARRIKKLRLRVSELENLGREESRGYVVPYCTDFSDVGLRGMLISLRRSLRSELLCTKESLVHLHRLVAIWKGFLGDCNSSDVMLCLPSEWSGIAEDVLTDLQSLALGKFFSWSSDHDVLKLQSQVVEGCQDILLWGVDSGLFEDCDRFSLLVDALQKLQSGTSSSLPASYFALMCDWRSSIELTSEVDCIVSFIRRALAVNTDASDGALAGLVCERSQAEELTSLLLQLSIREFAARDRSLEESFLGITSYSPVEKGLLALFNGCAIDMCAHTNLGSSYTTQVQHHTDANAGETLFATFAKACLQTCQKLVIAAGTQHPNGREAVSVLSRSICGKLLPLVLAMLPNSSRDTLGRLKDLTVELSQLLSSLTLDEHPTRTPAFLPSHRIVESTHPYNRTQAAMRKVVRIRGATCLHIQFDPRCSTSGEADFVLVTPGHAWFHSDRAPFGESGIGDAGGCFFGNRHSGNWPRGGISVWGDTVTIMLCSTSQERERIGGEDESRRWGLRCTVRGLRLGDISSWRNDVVVATELALRAQAQRSLMSCDQSLDCPRVVEAETLLHVVRRLQISLSESRKKLAEEILASDDAGFISEGGRIVKLNESFVNARRNGRPTSMKSQQWKRSLRFALAIFVLEAQILAPQSVKLSESSTCFVPIFQQVSKLEQWMVRQVQLCKEWQWMLEEKVSAADFNERFSGDIGRLRELCSMKRVTMETSDLKRTMAELYEVLLIDAEAPHTSIDINDSIANELIRKAEYALRVSVDAHPIETIPRPVTSRSDVPKSCLFDYFTSSLSMSDVRLADKSLERAFEYNMEGFMLLEDIRGIRRSSNSESVAAGALGSCWSVSTCRRLQLAPPRNANLFTTGFRSARTEISKLTKSARLESPVRLASIIDCLAVYERFGEGLTTRFLRDLTTTAIELVLDHVTGHRPTHSSVAEMVWMAFRLSIESLIGEGDLRSAFSILHELVGRLLSVNDQGKESVSLFRVMKIVSAHALLLQSDQTSAEMFTEVCLAHLLTPLHYYSSPVETASLRTLIMLTKKPDKPLPSTIVGKVPGLLHQFLERIGTLQSGIKVATDDSETKLKDCCVVLLDSERARSKIVELLDPACCDAVDSVCLPPTLSRLDLSVDSLAISATSEGQGPGEVVHWNVRCDGCNQSPLRGYRFKCFTCTNYDLCSACYANHSVHNVDHQFVRVAAPSSTGELLQPRSLSNGIVSEGSLIGSKLWIGSVLRSRLETYGYAIVYRGSSDVCLRQANSLSKSGFPSTVMEWPDFDRLERFYDWESVVQAAFEPGSGRLARRQSSSTSSPTPRKLDRSVISQFNETARQTRWGDRHLRDSTCLLSEMVAFTRLIWNRTAVQAVAFLKIVEYVQEMGPEVALLTSVDRAQYYRALGLASVLGSFLETFRTGAWVSMKEPVMNKQRMGIVKHYTGLSNSAAVIWCTRNGISDDEKEPLDIRISSTSQLEVTTDVELVNVHAPMAEVSPFFSASATVLKTAHKLLKSTPEYLAHHQGRFAAVEFVVNWLRMYMGSMGKLPSLLYQSSPGSGTGNLALLLFQLAKASKSGATIDALDAIRHKLWRTQQAVLSDCQFSVATRPVMHTNVGHDQTSIYGPGANGLSDLTEFVFNLYAYSSRSEFPQHSGRNKLLEYWEKYVIPAIEAYVAGSFKSYEMDYFFAQLREPLREGNPAAAMKIAFTLCDGHIPSGCHYPDPETDWSALQIDDIEIGSQYEIIKGASTSDQSDWPPEMKWTVGYPGVAKVVCPSGCVLMQLRNPTTARLEHWWYPVESLATCSNSTSISERSADKFGIVQEELVKLDLESLGVIARICVFSMLKNAPDHFPLVSGRQSSKIHFNIVDILRMAAGADLGVQAQSIVGENDDDFARGFVQWPSSCSGRHELMESLKFVLTKRFEYVPPATEDLSCDEQSGAAVIPQSSKSKVGKSSKAPTLMDHGSLKDSQASSAPFSGSCEGLSVVKYRFTLMEALAQELKRALEASAAFLQQSSFMVASDVPPKPIIMLKAPGASSLVISFAVHPVLMDLPAGSSLEFYEDEQCTKRVFGFFGDKRGLNYLPPLVIPGDECFVRASQAAYARYKFRVDPLTPDFGLALWIGDDVYQRMNSVSLSSFELESIVSSVLNSIADYLVSGVALLAPCVKGVVCQLLTKMINFAISRSLSNSVPLSKLSVLARDLAVAVSHEQEAQQGLYSLPTQQLAELLATVEEVSRLRGSSTFTFSTSWWPNLVRLSCFTRVLTQKRDAGCSPDILARISCGRTPVEDVDDASRLLLCRDLLCERMILLQQLPRTTRVAELEIAVSRFIQHIALEECGEADDQTVLSAAVVYRRGILAKVLHLPVNTNGETLGYAVVDIGRHDVTPRLLSRLEKECFVFEGDQTTEDTSLAEKLIGLYARDQGGAEETSSDVETVCVNEDSVWSCGVCTLENPTSEVECAACGSPIPHDVASIVGRRHRAPSTRTQVATSGRGESGGTLTTEQPSEPTGWQCDACTLMNPWEDTECAACGSERNPDLVEPSARVPDTKEACSQEQSTVNTAAHKLSGIMFVEVLRVATSEIVEQVNSFLIHCFTENQVVLKKELQQLIRSEFDANPADNLFTQAALQLSGLPGPRGEDNGDVCAMIFDIATSQPIQIYQWLREGGYDLNFDSSHFVSKELARASQAKWTYQMDVQLISLAHQVGSGVGVLSLLDLCPSFLNASQVNEGSLLYGLKSRDLRLRFILLKSFNKTAIEALSLVNLRNNSDSNALRARLVAVRQILFPAVKIRFFAETQDNAKLAQSNLVDANVKRPVVTLDRRRVAALRQQREHLSLKDAKASLFASTMEQLATVRPSVLRAKRPTGASDPFVAFIVVFTGENVVGEGGPYRQLFNDIANELLSSGNGLFLPTQNNAMKIGEYRDRFLPIPSATSRSMLKMYEFVGVLMGCCIRTGVRLNVRLAPIVWKMLVKQTLSMIDLEHIDFSVCESLKFIESAASDHVAPSAPHDAFFESFTTSLSDSTTVELKPGGGGIPVTSLNCREYVRLVKAARFQECKPQVDAILRGIGSIVPVHLLQLCTWSELQQWVCGSLAIDLDLLKRHTLYSSGMTPDKFPHLDMFWRVLSSFSEENKRRFINFAWGQDTLPADDAEFDRTHTRLLIKSPPVTDKNQDSLLPRADTCFFNIELPAYSSDEVMREKLIFAITMCTSMDGDEQAGRMDMYFASDDLDDDHME